MNVGMNIGEKVYHILSLVWDKNQFTVQNTKI